MHLIPIDQVKISPDRQRQENKNSKSVTELKADIAAHGLYHLPILTEDHQLVSGERRFLAVKELFEEGLTFIHDGETIPLGQLPYTRLLDADPITLAEVELHENLLRMQLSWREAAAAKVRIHELKSKQNPQQTQAETAKFILEQEKKPVTPEAVNAERQTLAKMKIVTENLNNPVVRDAPTFQKAYSALMQSRNQELERQLIRLKPEASPHKLFLGDFRTLSPTLESGSFDLIFSDPPYGINAHKSSSGALEHQYDDSPEYALTLYKHIIERGFDLLKPQGALLLFCDIEHFITLRTFAEQHAFSTFRTPLIWHKGSEGFAPWGREGFKRTYEILLYAVKGQKPLALFGGADVKLVPRPTVDPTKIHAAEKPLELIRLFLQLICRAGDKVLDPCAGSGPIFSAALGLGIHVTGCELNPAYHALAESRLAKLSTETEPESLVSHPETVTDSIDSILSLDE